MTTEERLEKIEEARLQFMQGKMSAQTYSSIREMNLNEIISSNNNDKGRDFNENE